MGESQGQTNTPEQTGAINEMLMAQIHIALHISYADGITINGVLYPKMEYKNGCKYIDYAGIRFMQQNKAKSSKYAMRAQMGYQITWGMRPGDWIYMESEINSDKVLVSTSGMQRDL